MGDRSKIQWTDASWTPIRARNTATGKLGWHCEHASDGCRFCYAEGMNKRLGTGLPFKPGHRGDIDLFLDEKMLLAPLGWTEPRMIFVCSMTDAFGEFVKDEWLDRMFAVMALCPQHTFQVLTKRSARMRGYLSAGRAHPVGLEAMGITLQCMAANPKSEVGKGCILQGDIAHLKVWPLPNVWLGVSCEDQERAAERIPDLLATPAAVRFVSAEPLLGPIDFRSIKKGYAIWQDALAGWWSAPETGPNKTNCLDWIIVGGESGPKSRPFRVEWAESIIDQCRAADVRCFVKQLGSNPRERGNAIGDTGFIATPALRLRDRKGGDASEWPEHLRVREFPQVSA